MRSKQKQMEEKQTAEKLPKNMTLPVAKKASRNGVYVFAFTIFLIVFGVFLLLFWKTLSSTLVVIAILAGIVIAYSVRIAPQWERVVVLRFGNFNRVAGPGLYFVIPVIEHVPAYVDQRMIVTPFAAEETLTADLVPLDIDAVLFWMVWNPKDACIEVEDYASAVWWSAQTALRDAIGRINLSEVATRREQLDSEVKDILEAKTRVWGITVLSVEIRDIRIPKDLQDSMSKEAQAERERNARLLLAEVEKDISDMFADAAAIYDKSDKAFQLRAMNLIYESMKEKGGLVIAPSAISEAFNNIQGFLK